MMIKVENKRSCSNGEYIGRPTVLGNPYTHLKGKTKAQFITASRSDSVQAYRAYAREQYNTNTAFKNEVHRLAKLYAETGELTLLCWCAPLECHGDVLARVIEFIAKRDYK